MQIDMLSLLYGVKPLSHSTENIYMKRLRLTTQNVYFTITSTGPMICMRPANEKRRYTVTPSLKGWVPIQNALSL